MAAPFPKSKMRSQLPTAPVNCTSAIAVNPPLDWIWKVRVPAFIYWEYARSNQPRVVGKMDTTPLLDKSGNPTASLSVTDIVLVCPDNGVLWLMALVVKWDSLEQPASMLPAREVLPSGQLEHAAVETLYFPAKQGVQLADPVWSLYLPAMQAIQGPPSGPVNPTGQTALVQLPSVVLPAGEVAYSGHGVHADASPTYVLYVPEGHWEHVPPHLKKFAVGCAVKVSSE